MHCCNLRFFPRGSFRQDPSSNAPKCPADTASSHRHAERCQQQCHNQGSMGWGWGWELFRSGHHHCFNPFFLSDISRRDIQAEVSVTNPASQSSCSYFFHLLHRDFNPCPPEPTNAKMFTMEVPKHQGSFGVSQLTPGVDQRLQQCQHHAATCQGGALAPGHILWAHVEGSCGRVNK